MRINQLTEIKSLAEHSADELIRNSFFVRMDDFEQIQTEFAAQHENIVLLAALQDDADTVLPAEDYTRKLFDADCAFIKSIFLKWKSKVKEEIVPNRPPPEIRNIKLPDIELPKFSGDFKHFRTFIDRFNSLVHNNASLNPIDKYNYLIASLSGPPLTLINSTPLSDDNYENAYKSLINRYDNKRLIAISHLQAIDNAPVITLNNKNAHTLRNLVDIFNENLTALKTFSLPVAEWDFLLYYILSKHLDEETKTQFEFSSSNSKNNLPTYANLTTFITNRCDSLDAIEFSKTHSSTYRNKNITTNSNKDFRKIKQFFVTSNPKLTCNYCKAGHSIYKCQSFRDRTAQERLNFVNKNKLCINCLSSCHFLKDCNSKSTCRMCNLKHHTMLHLSDKPLGQNASYNQSSPSEDSANQVTNETSTSSSAFTGMISSQKNHAVLLSTALVEVLDSRGNYQKLRILLDSGSQANFISQRCLNKLGLTTYPISLSVTGLGEMKDFVCNRGVNCTLKPVEKFAPIHTIDAVVIPKLCSNIPNRQLVLENWQHLKNVKFSDPQFHMPGQIDMLLGAEIFPHVLQTERLVGQINEPVALNTIFGWVLMGKTSCDSPTISCHFASVNDKLSQLDQTLKTFWELEEVPNITTSFSADDTLCESIYDKTVRRDSSGKYIVTLPFRGIEPDFDYNDTRSIALRRFYSTEKRLLKNKDVYKDYKLFMQNYLDSGYMMEIKDFSKREKCYYIPHHCVIKPESTTTKLRVVFDASCKTSLGISLNDTLLIGPKLQKEIFSVLLNFRCGAVAFTADIKQMFLQIGVQADHQDYLRILWRFSPEENIKDYKLTTVTFGLSCSPYLANKTLLKLAQDEAKNYPIAAPVLQTCMYIDDLAESCNDLNTALTIQKEISALLKKGGFELRKWASNSNEFLEGIPESERYSQAHSFDQDEGFKVLGLKWQPNLDFFSFSVSVLNQDCTKRSILSEISRIFDPLGFLTPITLHTKSLMQRLWTLGLDWDEKPPPEICLSWSKYKIEIYRLSEIYIPRCIISNTSNPLEVHGFCDASEKGYASVVYFREKIGKNYKVYLVCAKGKVSPLKSISIPRLELCAASLLADLWNSVQLIIKDKVKLVKSYFWTDSSIVLHWLRSSPYKWKTFVSNRVSKIQDIIPPSFWHYIKSADNPADCASRGLLPSQLLHHPLWWAGPPWLYTSNENWPTPKFETDIECSEFTREKRSIVLMANIDQNAIEILLAKFSSLITIQSILAFILRFVKNCKTPNSAASGPIKALELSQALNILVKHVQQIHFGVEIALIQNRRLPSKYLRKLNAFLDKDNILRVGGRLSNSKLSYAQKYPMLLPKKSRLTELVISQYHTKYLHPGNQTLHYLLLQHVWILSAKQAIRKVISQCKKCWKLSPKNYQPPMGNLPELRISKIKPFSCVGVDFAGPITTKLAKIRGAKTYKSYICVFVCFAVKAIHLELVSDLSTEAFLAAFRRFLSRRGRCAQIYSDCGSNFVGANRQIKEMLRDTANKENFSWHFNPPAAPHFSGLVEAGVKSVKTHLLRVIGLQILTFEEMSTVLCQIEALLNSRPLCPLSTDPNDFSVLSPGHFLTLEPLSSLPDPDYLNLPLNHLSRWQLLQRMQQDFWSRWRDEYLSTLQQRGKWLEPTTPDASIGKLVVIKNELLPPLKWTLGRIVQLHPGKDGIARVATVRTIQGTIKRPLVKLCPLPDTPIQV